MPPPPPPPMPPPPPPPPPPAEKVGLEGIGSTSTAAARANANRMGMGTSLGLVQLTPDREYSSRASSLAFGDPRRIQTKTAPGGAVCSVFLFGQASSC